MAGRFSFSVPGRRSASDPWFRIGTLDVSTTMLTVLLCVAGIFLWALDQNAWEQLVLIPDEVRNGQLWRLVTWPLANQPDLWTVISLALFWYFGREVEGLLGRTRFAVLLVTLAVVPGLVGVALDIGIYSAELLQLSVFLIFVAEYPYLRFFFGIPAWAIGAVIVAIQVLQYLGIRDSERIILLFVAIATAALMSRSMGLLRSLPWVPKLPLPGSGSSRPKRSRAKPVSRPNTVVEGPWTRRGGPPTGLPQPPMGPSASDQAELDSLLDKISATGMDGLTADEKHRLNELSKRLRNRK